MNRLKRLLIKHEGFENKPYEDSLGNLTIGVGRNLSQGLTRDEVLFLLNNDIARCDRELKNNFRWYFDLCRTRQEAMIDLCFNLGITRLLTFKKALAAMAELDYDKAAEEILDSKYATQVGRRAITVSEMIRTGRYQ